jgi:hypothetical protein
MPELLLRLVMMALGRISVGKKIAAATYRAMTAGLCLALSGLALFGAFACAGVGIWLLAAPQIGSAGASFVVAGALLAVGLLLVITARHVLRHKQTSSPNVEDTNSQLLREATELFKTHKETMLLAALIAGIVVETAQRRK